MFLIILVVVGNLWFINVNSGREVFIFWYIGGIEIYGFYLIDSWD